MNRAKLLLNLVIGDGNEDDDTGDHTEIQMGGGDQFEKDDDISTTAGFGNEFLANEDNNDNRENQLYFGNRITNAVVPVDNVGFISDSAELLKFKRNLKRIHVDDNKSDSEYIPAHHSYSDSTETLNSENIKLLQNELMSLRSNDVIEINKTDTNTDCQTEWLDTDLQETRADSEDLITPSDLGITDFEDNFINFSVALSDKSTKESALSSDNTGESSDDTSQLSRGNSPQSSKSGSTVTSPISSPGRKRKRDASLWKNNLIKRLRNSGQEYINTKGKIIEKRTLKPGCGEKCKKKCHKKVTQEERQEILSKFWELGDHQKQILFLSNYIEKIDKKVEVVKKGGKSRRKWTNQYFLPKNGIPKSNHEGNDPTAILESDERSNSETAAETNNKKIKVCKKTFLETFAINDVWVSTTLKKKEHVEETFFVDQRGRHSNRPNRIPDDVKDSVRKHINMIPSKESHYVRKTSSKLYFHEELSFPKLYMLYVSWMDTTNPNDTKATKEQYRNIFMTEFNIGFFQPKKDRCLTCEIQLSGSTNEIEERRPAYSFHIANKTIARQLKDMDHALAKENPNIIVACYDMQKVLTTPQSEVSIFYYKRKFAFYNFTIYSLSESEGHCYVWDESIGKKGPNEICSALLLFIKKKVDEGATEFRFYSDCCGGQNRNRIIFATYSYACAIFNIDISHHFFEVGHSQSEGDSMHALIERRKKNMNIYVPSQWVTLIEAAKVTGKPYTVTEMSQSNIFDFKSLLPQFPNLNLQKSLDSNGRKVMWSKIQYLKIHKEDPYTMEFQYDFYSDKIEKTNFHYRPPLKQSQRITKKAKATREIADPPNPVLWNEVTLSPAYTNPLPITKAKYKDLNALCTSGAIPEKYREFYRRLQTSNDALNDSDEEEI